MFDIRAEESDEHLELLLKEMAVRIVCEFFGLVPERIVTERRWEDL